MELMQFLLDRNLGETKTIKLGGELSDYDISIKSLSTQQWGEARKQCLTITQNGIQMNQDKLNALIVLDGCVNPNFRDAETLQKANLTLPIDLIYKVFKPGEIEKLANEILNYSGFGQDIKDIPKK